MLIYHTYGYVSILFMNNARTHVLIHRRIRMRYKHNPYYYVIRLCEIYVMATNHVRNQRKKQNARQATVISGLSTIYRNQSITHLIQTHQQTEPRIFLLDITLDEMNKMYPTINRIIEKGRLRPKGTEVFFVYKKMEHYIISEDVVYEIHGGHGSGAPTVTLNERIPVDGPVSIVELIITRDNNKNDNDNDNTPTTVPLLVDESYYKLSRVDSGGGGGDTHANTTFTSTHVSPKHIIKRHMKIVVKTHPKSMNAFVFIMNETETELLDFYMTTENGIIATATATATAASAIGGNGNADIITKTCKDDIISFIDHFKLCS